MKRTENIVRNLICAFIIGWMASYILLGYPMSSYTLENTRSQNWIISIGIMLVTAAIAFGVGLRKEIILHLSTIVFVFAAGVLSLFIREDGFEALGFALIIGLTIYLFREDIYTVTKSIVITDRQVKQLYIILGTMLFLFAAMVGSLRYYAYFSDGHDLGIFTQMYEYMLSTGRQLSTVERDELLSHFEVHISPIYYVLLPIFFLFRSALTLQICQAVLIALSIWPFYLLCRHFKLSNKITVVLGIGYVCYPALSGGCFNDFHENCFLPLLLFLLIYAVEKNKNVLFAISMVLALFVKEDVSIQLLVLGLYFVISEKSKKKGYILMVTSALYLGFTLWLLNYGYEGGVLNYMSNMYLTENEDILEVIKTVLMNPGYALRQCFVSPEKIHYMGWILMPVIGTLVIRKKYSRYILFAYMIFMNLMPAHGALNDIYFQYHFPVVVFLFYFIMMSAADWECEDKVNKLPIMVGMTVFLFCVSVFQSGLYIGIETIQTRENIEKLNEAVDMIPENASVRASSLIVPHLTAHKELYGFYVEKETDYIIIDYRPKAETEYEYIEDWMNMEHYEEIYFVPDVVRLYKLK